MKLTKYWYISLIGLFSCQNDIIETIEEVPKINPTEVYEIEMDSLSLSENTLAIDTVKENDTTLVIKKEIIKKTNVKKEKHSFSKTFEPEPDEEYKFPKEMYFEVIKSQKFYDDSVKFYSWFMRSEYWRKEYGYPDSAEYHKKYLSKWAGRIRRIKSDYDWSK